MTDYYYPPALLLTGSSEQTQFDAYSVPQYLSPTLQSHWAQKDQAVDHHTNESHCVYSTISPIFPASAHDEYQCVASAAQDAYVQPPIYVNTESHTLYPQPETASYEEKWMYQEQEAQTCDDGQNNTINSDGFLCHDGSTYALDTDGLNYEVLYDTHVVDFGSQMVSSPTSAEFEYSYQTEQYAEMLPHSPVKDRRASIAWHSIDVNSYPIPIIAYGDSHALPQLRIEQEALGIPHMIFPSQEPLVNFKNTMWRQSKQYEEPVTRNQPYQQHQPPNATHVDGRACRSDVPDLFKSASYSAHHPYAPDVQSPYIDNITDLHARPYAQQTKHYHEATGHQTWSGQQPPAAQPTALVTGGELLQTLAEPNPLPVTKPEPQRASIPSHSRRHEQPESQAPWPSPPSQQQESQPPPPHCQPSPSRYTHSSQAHLPLTSRYRKVPLSSSVTHASATCVYLRPRRPSPIACIFCRGRKIACGPPPPGSTEKTCNQCAQRHLICEFPLEWRRGMRKPRPLP